jgi:Aspartyl/asparaginyl-tRNA synthetases
MQSRGSGGADLASEHERYLVEEHCKKPVILTDYPKEIKSFYMKQNDDSKTVRAMDVLFPKIGEIIGGSQRESRTRNLRAERRKWAFPKRIYGGTSIPAVSVQHRTPASGWALNACCSSLPA